MYQILRRDVPEKQVWNLRDIFNSDENWERVYLVAEKEIDEIMASSILLNNSKNILDWLNKFEELLVILDQNSSYAMFKYSEDESDASNQQRNEKAQKLMGKASIVKTQFVNAVLAISQRTMHEYKQENEEIR